MSLCKSCAHSIQYWSKGRFGMYCEEIQREAEQEECEVYMREPGSDAEELEND